MTGEKREVSRAREAADALRRVISRVQETPATELGPRSAALDELVRLADLLGRTVEGVAGEEARAVRSCADELAAALAARRDAWGSDGPRTSVAPDRSGRPLR